MITCAQICKYPANVLAVNESKTQELKTQTELKLNCEIQLQIQIQREIEWIRLMDVPITLHVQHI